MKKLIKDKKIISIISSHEPSDYEWRILKSGVADEYLLIYEDCTGALDVTRVRKDELEVKFDLTEEDFNLITR
jgi:iron uptake system EfeUOB component EfeO/EfeM